MILTQTTSAQADQMFYNDPKGSGLIMYSVKRNGRYIPKKTWLRGLLTDAQRATRSDMLDQDGVQIESLDTGKVYEVVGGQWVVIDSLSPAELAALKVGVVTASASRALTPADNGATIDCLGPITLTVPVGLPAGFMCNIIPTGTLTLAPGNGTILFNGVNGNVTRTAMFGIQARSTAGSYIVTGS